MPTHRIQISVAALILFALPRSIVAQAPAAQSNLSLMTNDHYTRSHDYDLVHQRIVVSHFNWDSTSFDGRVTTTLVSHRQGLDTIVLDEGKLLSNSAVTDQAGRPLKNARTGDTLLLFPARPLAFGDTLVVTVTYHARIKSGEGLTFLNNDGLSHRPDQIWSQGEDHNNHCWFPTYDFPNDKMTWELVATVPAAMLAISNGKLISNTVTAGHRTMTWHQDRPSASYLVSLIVAPLVLTHDTWQGIPVDYYTYREDSTRAWKLFHVTTDMIATYSRLTGVRYPWAKYAQTTVADFFGGMENVSATTLVDWLPDARAYRDRPWYQYILIPHELAHQWFGDYVTTVNWANMWLNEGFAEFMPGQYWNDKLGAHAEQEYYADEYRQYLEIEGRRSMPLASLGSNNIYPKGALVLKMLKEYLGPERFWASVHSYLTAHALGNATSDDLRQAVLAATGENLDWFWDEWVYASGHPAFTVTASYDRAQSRVTLNIRQTQVDTFTVDSTGRRFTMPAVFRMPVTIRVGFPGGERSYRTEINAREQVVNIEGIAAEPTMVIFDDGNRVLKSLAFDQPVPWLATQLRTDANLWNRQWVIGQLARHPDDSQAQSALVEAAARADYFTTRVQAIGALASLPAAVATPALSAAVQDTSAAVRAAAIGALHRFATTETATLARQLFEHDSSDVVRATALGTLINADRMHTHDALAAALAMPSYQDAIQSAGLQGILATNDTAFIPQIDAIIAQQEFPAHVLAALGGRGSAHALAVITGHLNDARAGVRRWTVAAFTNTLAQVNRSVALQQLKGALAGLTFRETRQQVADLIATLEKP